MATFGTLGTLSIALIFFILAKLSERFGTVIKMKPIFQYYYISVGLALFSFLIHFLAVNPDRTFIVQWLTAPWFLLVAYYLPLTVSVTIGLIVTWRYWSWLVTEQDR